MVGAATARAGQKKKELRVFFWNTQRWRAGVEDERGGWLREQITLREPTVVALAEVEGSREEFKRAQKWARAQGYDAKYVVGEDGGGTRVDGSAAAAQNGMVVMVRRSEAALKVQKRLAPRVMGVVVQHKTDRKERRYVFLHGVHGAGFRGQLKAAQEFAQNGGALVAGDWNHVPCGSWRASGELGARDRWVQKMCGGVCGSKVVGGAGGVAPGEVGWTQFAGVRGADGRPTSRVDYAVVAGPKEEAWREEELVAAETEVAGRIVRLSDHVMVEWTLEVKEEEGWERRAQPVWRGAGKVAKMAQGRMRERDEEEVAEALHAAAAAAEGRGRNGVDCATELLMRGAREAVTGAQMQIAAELEGVATARQVYRDWQERLRVAVKMRKLEVDVRKVYASGTGLMHPKAGLRRMLESGGAAAHLSSSDTWTLLIKKARRQVRRAGRHMLARERAQGKAAVEAAREQPGDDERSRANRTWAALREAKASPAMEFIHATDSLEGECIPVADERFPAAAAAIGEQVVSKLDRGALEELAKAWLEIFVAGFDPIKGVAGGEFLMAEELTFQLFVETLYAMPRGKAVGQSGFSVEVLRVYKKGGPVQRAIYDEVMTTMAKAEVPPSWRNVVYALLVKPPPNNAEIIGERREIAIMEQLMKTVVQAVRAVSYKRMEGRTLAPQLGWLQGHSTAHAGF